MIHDGSIGTGSSARDSQARPDRRSVPLAAGDRHWSAGHPARQLRLGTGPRRRTGTRRAAAPVPRRRRRRYRDIWHVHDAAPSAVGCPGDSGRRLPHWELAANPGRGNPRGPGLDPDPRSATTSSTACSATTANPSWWRDSGQSIVLQNISTLTQNHDQLAVFRLASGRRQMNVLFIIGRPAAGKTTIARRLKTGIKGKNRAVRTAMIDEYDFLRERAKDLGPPAVEWRTDGTFELLDRTLLSETAQDVQRHALSHMPSHDLIICEFARSTYTDLFDACDDHIKTSMQILYIDVPLELCRIRNQRRRNDKTRPFVPDSVLTKYYAHDDAHELPPLYNGRYCVINNSRDNYNSLVEVVDEYIELNCEHLTANHRTQSEIGVL